MAAVALTTLSGPLFAGVIASIPRDLVETGTPNFAVLGQEALGLSGAPTDLQMLPDGRILAVSDREISIGDGMRWDVFRSADDQSGQIADKVAVDRDGKIYTGTEGHIARIDFGEDARWRLVPVATLPPESGLQRTVLKDVTVLPDGWYWNGGTGAIIAWRPGESPRIAGDVSSATDTFMLGKDVYVSSGSSGATFRLDPAKNTAVSISSPTVLASDTISCTAPYGPGILLVGTHGAGFKLFDGVSLHDCPMQGPLGSGHRINDLCSVGDGLFAAAVDSFGIAFFDRNGRTVQVLDRSLDHRLARTQRLKYAANGVLWAVLGDSVARVEFPSSVSHFEPLLPGGINTAQPVRYQGRLWMVADGRTLRGVYDRAGRLERFEDDTAPGYWTPTMMVVDGKLFATTDSGLYVREGNQWKTAVAGINAARMGFASPRPQGWFYAARHELGWIRQTADGGYTAVRYMEPGLPDIYHGLQDDKGTVWLELGMAGAGRVDISGDRPQLRILGTKEGLSNNWVNAFPWNGEVHFTTNGRHLRFDESKDRFVEDTTLAREYPEMAHVNTRPARDGLGRIWFGSNNNTYMLEPGSAGKKRSLKAIPVGFDPSEFMMEENGVVWMWAPRHLARYDPEASEVPDSPLRATINFVQFTASGRHVFSPGKALPPLAYADNSIVIHYGAPANPFGPPITFEVMLQGGNAQWSSTGGVGSAAFNRLKEGDYVFHVRPVGRSKAGEEAVLAFSVQPPWFRTPLAWTLYATGGLGTIALAAWLSSYLARREKERLAHVVAERTRELRGEVAVRTQAEQELLQYRGYLEQLVAERTTALRETNTQLQKEVTERKLGEEALRISEDRYRRFFEDDLAGAFIATPDAKLLDCNPAFARIFGFADVAEVKGFDLTALFNEATQARELFGRLQQERRVQDCELELRNRQGKTVHVLAHLIGNFDAAGQWVQIKGYVIDVTVRIRLESQLRQSQKMEAIGQLAGGIAHDFNNLLTAIVGCSDILMNDPEATPEIRSSAGEIRDAGHRAASLTRQLLAFSRKQRLQPRVLDLNHVVSEMERMLCRLIGENVQLRLQLAPTVERIKADPSQIEQIILNLAVNARDAMPNGGRLTIETANTTLDEQYASQNLDVSPGNYVRISVTDTGHGMSPEIQAHVFEPFFTTKSVGKGTGLGLSTVYGIVKQSNGHVSFTSHPGQGTTFNILLPSAGPGEVPADTASPPTPRLQGKETILLVEDNQSVLKVAQRILEAQGFRVLPAADAGSALTAYARADGAIDLLLTDVIMPEVSGPDLAKRILATNPAMKILFMSGYTDDILDSVGGRLAGVPLLGKPFLPDTLVQKVRETLDHPSPLLRPGEPTTPPAA